MAILRTHAFAFVPLDPGLTVSGVARSGEHRWLVVANPTDTLNPLNHLIAATMMLPTHALAGMAAALPFALAVPELGGVALLAGFVGGAIPDLDLYAGHRKSLHYPVYYPTLAVPTLALTLVSPTAVTAGAAFLLFGAALHSVMDVLGGGLELHPWAATSDRAVYDHFHGRWLPPRRVIPYDGSVEDLLLAGGLGLPLIVLATGELRWLVVIAFLVATVYTAVRRQLPDVAVWLLETVLHDRLPDRALARVPERYRRGTATAVPDAGG